MCIICLELEKDRLTPREALNNYSEMVETMDPEHAEELGMLISDLLLQEMMEEEDEEDENWENTT